MTKEFGSLVIGLAALTAIVPVPPMMTETVAVAPLASDVTDAVPEPARGPAD